jgi:O-antigen biosynthesis protein
MDSHDGSPPLKPPHPPESPLSLSVVIVNYNVRNLLENCLHSLFSSLESIPSEVLVVDNCSDDGSVDMVRSRFPQVRVFENDRNLGFAKANNIALAEARGSMIWLLNPDTLVQEDTARVMLRFFEDNPDVGMAGCKILLPSGELQPSCRRSFPSPWVSFTKLTGLNALFPRSRVFGRYNLTYLNEDESYEVDAISGSCMMIRREVYERTGGLDERFFMYGEDLDWCYQVQKAGWKVYYVHSTKIIHYSGESTRRSSIDAKSIFYEAMQLFARKNLGLSRISLGMISLAIHLRLMAARSRDTVLAIVPVAIDAVLIAGCIALVKYIRYGTVLAFPAWAYPAAFLVPVAVFIASLLVAGAYTKDTYRYTRAMVGVLMGFFVLSSLTYFFKEYAFSRIIVLSSSGLAFMLLQVQRLLWSLTGRQHRIDIVTGKPTLVVGSNQLARSMIQQLRNYDAKTYNVIGAIDINRRHLGEKVEGVEIIGSVDNIGKAIQEHGITDVIFAPDVLSYAEILTIISRTRGRSVHYRIAPKSLEFIIGKADIDQLTGLPLLDVECNLLKPLNRLSKRLFDMALAVPGLIALFPFVYFARPVTRKTMCSWRNAILSLPSVLAGRMSLVGHPVEHNDGDQSFIDKPGLTGLAQLRQSESLSRQEAVTLSMHYARNYSVFLDIEIIFRSIARCLGNSNHKQPRNASHGENDSRV